jgi:transcriptional regulator with XRE-family HTH domain
MAAGLTQIDLARRLGKGREGQSAVSNWELGHVRISLESLIHVARAIGCKPSELDPWLAEAAPGR